MDGFTLLDGAVAAIILISALLAYSRGLIHESLAILGWIAAAVVAYLFTPQVVPLVKEIPYVGPYMQESCELAIIASFIVVFGLGLIVISIFSPLMASAVKHSMLGGIDQSLGFIFGALRGVVLVAVALLVYDRVVVSSTFPIIDDSRTARVFAAVEADLETFVPTDLPGWVLERYEDLVGSCGA